MIKIQSPEVFCKKSFSKKFRKIHRKTPVPESLLAHVFSCEFCQVSKKTFFTEHPQETASENYGNDGNTRASMDVE